MHKLFEMSDKRDEMNMKIADLKTRVKDVEGEIMQYIFDSRQYDLLAVKWGTIRKIRRKSGYDY